MSGRPGLVLDAGAFIALERGDVTVSRLLDYARRAGTPLITSAGVVAQVWRGGRDKQSPLAFVLRGTTVEAMDLLTARLLGLLLGASGTSDPIDAHVVVIARAHGWPIVTSDPADLRRIDPSVELEAV